MNRSIRLLTLLLLILPISLQSASAQDKLRVSGVIFSDYYYTFSSPGGTSDGENGFDFRRVYLTTDYALSDRFDVRFRLEGSDGTTTTDGKPAAFVKDLYIRWKNALGNGHNITFGVTSPPLWLVSEKQWAYRGLEKTIMDRGKHASSRDMGIVLNGPLTTSGKIKYGLMFANNSGGKQEQDKFKRLYGQLEFYPTDQLKLTVGGDYYEFEGGNSLSGNAFVGYSMDAIQVGLEGFLSPKAFDGTDENDTSLGASLFGMYQVRENQRFVARFDFLGRDNLGSTSENNWVILGYSFVPEKGIEIIPNLIYDKNDSDDDPTLTGRLTVLASF